MFTPESLAPSAFIWHKHLKRYSYWSKWWYIYREDRRLTRDKRSDLFLYAPGMHKVAAPDIILKRRYGLGSLNCYNIEDRTLLADKAVQWRPSVSGLVFNRARGKCQCCQWDLIASKERFEFHHVRPIFKGRSSSPKNLVVLCRQCHKYITVACNSNNRSSIYRYTAMGLLPDV